MIVVDRVCFDRLQLLLMLECESVVDDLWYEFGDCVV